MEFDAIVLAGGAGTRLGGADKAGVEVGGVPLLDRVLTASAAARRTVVVGVPRPTSRVVEWTLEHPPGGGPLAGLAAGVAALEPSGLPAAGGPSVLVLATDLARLSASDIQRLVRALAEAGPDCSVAAFVDDQGHVQPLSAIYRRAELVAAIAGLQPVDGGSMRSLLRMLTLIEVPDRGASADIDTPDQLAEAQQDSS